MEVRGARTLVLDVPGWPGHQAGQHVDVRLTAANGHSAQRSYSIASVSKPDRLELPDLAPVVRPRSRAIVREIPEEPAISACLDPAHAVDGDRR